MNGPVKIFVAEALDDMMAGDPADDASEPLYVNACAPVDEIAAVEAPGVIGPITFIVAADEHANPTVPDPPTTDPDMFRDVPVKATAAVVPPPKRDPVMVKFPTVWDIAGEAAVPDPPVTDPIIIVLPAVVLNAVLPPPPLAPANKLPVIVMVPTDVLFMHRLPTPEFPPVKLIPFKTKSQFPVWVINSVDATAGAATLLPIDKVTVPDVAVTCTKLVAPGTSEVLSTTLVQLPLILPLLKLNVPPAATALADAVFLIDNT
jgi:hypothetical protein